MIHVDNAIRRLLKRDPGLAPYAGEIRMHLDRFNDRRWRLTGDQSLTEFANGYNYFGFHRTEAGWVFREWLPGADAAWLTGDFNGWQKFDTPLVNIGSGVWEVRLEGRDRLRHGQFVKLMVGRQGTAFERIPAYITRCVMDMSDQRLCGQVWMPDAPFQWTDSDHFTCQRPEAPMIYEAHIGMAQEHRGIGSYREFADQTLEWIRYQGYNVVQLMGVQEHPLYASFGYQVTNFFAPSHRYGTPEDLKYLINKAHGMGISVLLDVVHDCACANVGEGLNQQDGTDAQYFAAGPRGWLPGENTRVFDYGRHEVLHFLLSNLKYWMEEFHFDGFRFGGVAAMLYENHGACAFEGYDSYFSMNTNVDARVYLMLANALVHDYNAAGITIAEDASGFPGMALPIEEGGVGFDYRVDTGVPRAWIDLAESRMQEDWDLRALWRALTDRRPGEGTIGCVECHDQALAGERTLMFRLAGAEMYTGMLKEYHSPSMDRAIDMHKVIRFLTCATAADGYLNFIGNEFGHPEWVDFPREGNGWSYEYARRQWSLVQSWEHKYEWLASFDRGMTFFASVFGVHGADAAESLWIDDEKKLLIFSRAGLLFAFNLHPTWSQPLVFISTRNTGPGGYRAVLSTDEWSFGGQERISKEMVYTSHDTQFGHGIELYLPCRTGIALQKVE